MGIISFLIKCVLVILIISLLAIVGFLIYENYPRAEEILRVKAGEVGLYDEEEIVNASSELSQFVKNMRFNHNDLTYFMADDCSKEKRQKFLEALEIIQTETEIISFRGVFDETISDIEVGCSRESIESKEGENVFIAGEGGPTKYINLSLYSVILKGKVMLYGKSSCDYPITELHELFHVFGFDHISNKSLIMYPYVDCKQKINPELITKLKELYSITPAAELYFSNASFIKMGVYLNLDIGIRNEGLIEAEKVSLEVLDEDKELIKKFELGNISVGGTQKFYVTYLKLPSVNTEEINLIIKTSTREFNQDNNLINAGI